MKNTSKDLGFPLGGWVEGIHVPNKSTRHSFSKDNTDCIKILKTKNQTLMLPLN